MNTLRQFQEQLMQQEAEIFPVWIGYYLKIPYVSRGLDFEGCDDWGLCRLILSWQMEIAVPSFLTLDKEEIFKNILNDNGYYNKYLVALEQRQGCLFGFKLPNYRMITMLKEGSCLVKYKAKENKLLCV